MVFISIGESCCIKYQLNLWKEKQATLFFDWLQTDMKSVILILSCNDIIDILHP